MKYALIGLLFSATTAQADSFCGVKDEAAILASLRGGWFSDGMTSLESETLSGTDVQKSTALVSDDGYFEFDLTIPLGRATQLTATDTPYSVDHVDDILETVEAEWIADAVSETPCGPEDLLQLTALLDLPPRMTGTVTLIPYFSDRVVIIAEVEMRGDWGLGFVTMAALLTPYDDAQPTDLE